MEKGRKSAKYRKWGRERGRESERDGGDKCLNNEHRIGGRKITGFCCQVSVLSVSYLSHTVDCKALRCPTVGSTLTVVEPT